MAASPHLNTPSPAAPPIRGFVIAGSLVLLGLLVAMLRTGEPDMASMETLVPESRRTDSVESAQVAKIKSAELPDELGSKLALDAPQASEITSPDLKELTLTERLDDFFLNNVALDNIPLGKAMALLKQMLLVTDKQKALALHKLIVSIPTAALGRLVTLHSTSISYLEAVRTLATMAGCDVDLGDHRITLKTQAGPWPQAANKRFLQDMLDRQDEEVAEKATDQLAELRRDAARMGVQFNSDGSASMTASQWESLRRMSEYRRRLELSLIPPFAVYLLPEGYLAPVFQVTPQQIVQLMMTLQQQGFPAYADVPYALLDPTIAQQIVIIVRVGEQVTISQHTTIPTAEESKYEEVAVTQPVGGALEEHSSMQLAHGHSATLLQVELRQPGEVSRIGEGDEARLVQSNAAISMSAIEAIRAAEALRISTQASGYRMGSMLQAPATEPVNPGAAPTTPSGS